MSDTEEEEVQRKPVKITVVGESSTGKVSNTSQVPSLALFNVLVCKKYSASI